MATAHNTSHAGFIRGQIGFPLAFVVGAAIVVWVRAAAAVVRLIAHVLDAPRENDGGTMPVNEVLFEIAPSHFSWTHGAAHCCVDAPSPVLFQFSPRSARRAPFACARLHDRRCQLHQMAASPENHWRTAVGKPASKRAAVAWNSV